MRWGPEAERLREVVRAAVAEARTTGHTPVVLIDGPSGAGKSSLADLLVGDWPAEGSPRLVRMDDVYPGWDGLDAASAAIGRELLEPLRASGAGRWRRWDWAADAPAEWHEVRGDDPLVVEGCGTLAEHNARAADLALWLDAEDALRKSRALARDGLGFELHWDQWQDEFDRFVARERPRSRAGLVLDVTDWPIGAVRAGAFGANVVP